MKKSDNLLKTDTPYIHNEGLPTWIIPISGWGMESMEEAHKKMNAYKRAAEQWKINVEFSSRLGTFQSCKNAPSVSKAIREHNDITFAVFNTLFGLDWRLRFVQDVNSIG